MQKTYKDICKQVSEKKGLDEELLSSVAVTVFQEISRLIKKPESLIIYIHNLGKMYGRNKKTKHHLSLFKNSIIENPDKVARSSDIEDTMKSMEFLIEKGDEFIKIRKEFKNKRQDGINNNNTND